MRSSDDFLTGGGELGALMRAHDWNRTPLGAPATWPRSLKTAVRIMLTSRQPIWVGWGPELTYLYNDPYKSIIGGKHPHALGRPFREVWSEIFDYIGPMAESVMRRNEGTYVEAQLLIMERHGYQEETYYTFSYSPVPDDDGAPGGIICANTDDTRRVIGERELATLRDLAAIAPRARSAREVCALSVEAFAASPHDVVFALIYLEGAPGSDLELVAATPGTAALADPRQWPCTEVRAAKRTEIVRLDAALTDVPAGAWPRPPFQAAVLPIELSVRDGRTGVLVVGLNPYREFDERYGDFLQLAGRQVAAGIANADAYEQERARAEALAELDRAKTTFFSNVSHEFRTPLTLMMGPLEDLLGDEETLPRGATRQRLEVAYRNSARLLKLVNTLLDVSRIEAGRMQVAYEPTDLATLTAELASMFRSATDRAGLTLTVACEPLPAAAYVDREMWEKIVLNLLSNAFKFTFEGAITVTLRAADGRAVLTVRDTGTGIPGGDLPHVFERFHRVQDARGRSIEGSGIGLALVRDLVRLHGGEVGVESELGRGSAFSVVVPLGAAHLPPERIVAPEACDPRARSARTYVEGLTDAAAEEPPAAARGAGAGGGRRARIVLADDNADMRSYVLRLLALDYDVEGVTDGEAALAAIRRHRPDLVLTDVMMPKLDGFGLIAALRADDDLRTIPVIMLSARAGEEARVEGVAAGADDYLVKPFGARELLARVAGRLELERLQAEVAVQRASFASLFAQTPVATAVLQGPDLVFELANDAYRAVVGGRDVVGRRLLDALPEFDGQGFDDRLRGVMASGRAYVGREEKLRLERDGVMQDAFFTYIYAPWHVPDGRVGRVIAVCLEVTDQVRARDAIAEADRRKDEFLATLAHELRNPLAPLRNALHVLQTAPEADKHRLFEMMGRQVDHLVRLVDDLMEVSRISRGVLELRRERVEVATIVRNALEASAPLIEKAGHRIHVSFPARALWIDGDPVRLAQVVANIVNNAARYTDPGGNIWIEVGEKEGKATIVVRDDGSGIAPEALSRIFELFSRGKRARARSQDGLGIGLALARSLATMHGGTVSATSAGSGQGSTFTIVLPLATAGAPKAVAESRTAAMLRALRVLVVDDNRDAAESLGMLLETLGAEVRVAYDGSAALRTVDAFEPQVAFLDIGMPDMDGYEVARELRRSRPTCTMRLVALTGWGQEDDRRRAREAGFDHHLVKPVDLTALERLLVPLASR